LKALATSGSLHPRQDMVWCHRMDEWKAAGEIDGLYERKEVKTEDAQESSTAPTAEAEKPAFAEVDLWAGASRRGYLLRALVFPVVWVLLAVIVAQSIGPKLSPGFQKLCLLVGLLVPLGVVIDVLFSRLANLGMSKLWFLGYAVPVVNLWVGYRSFACPAGYAKSKKLDGIGWLLAVVYWLAMLSLVSGSLLAPALLSGWVQASGLPTQIAPLEEQLRHLGKRPEDIQKEKEEAKKKQQADDPNQQAR
jgi:hypothetical protein